MPATRLARLFRRPRLTPPPVEQPAARDPRPPTGPAPRALTFGDQTRGVPAQPSLEAELARLDGLDGLAA